MTTLIQDCQQVLAALQALTSDNEQPLCPEKKSLLRRVAVDLLAVCRAPKRLAAPAPAPAGTATPLTPREIEVAQWIAKGLTDSEIGAVLGISTRTVNTHRDRLLQKLNVRSRSAVATWMTQHYRAFLGLLFVPPLAQDLLAIVPAL